MQEKREVLDPTAIIDIDASGVVNVTTTETTIRTRTYPNYDELTKQLGREHFLAESRFLAGFCVYVGSGVAEVVNFGRFIVERGVHIRPEDAIIDQAVWIAFIVGGRMLANRGTAHLQRLDAIDEKRGLISSKIPAIFRRRPTKPTLVS